MLYLSNPVTVEDSFESLGSLPPIQLSICKKYIIEEPQESAYDYFAGYKPHIDIVPPGSILTFANSTEAFWQEMDSRGERYRPGYKT